MPELVLEVGGMHCAACVSHVEKAIAGVAGVTAASVSLATQRATVRAKAPINQDDVIAAVRRAGYDAKVAPSPLAPVAPEASTPTQGAPAKAKRAPWTADRWWLTRTLIGLPVAGAVMVLAMVYPKVPWSPWAQMGGTSLLMLVIGLPIVWSALRGLIRKRLDMDALVALGTSAAFGWSLYVLLAGVKMRANEEGIYFESAAVILALIALGRWLEIRTRTSAASAVRSLMDLAPPMATKFTGQRAPNDLVEVPAATLAVDDVVLVKPGQRIPADGLCELGTDSAVDESMLTGESAPVQKRGGDKATGGTLNTSGLIKLRVTATGRATVLAQIARVVEEAQSRKGKLQRMADKVAGVFVPIVVVVAVLTLLYWGLMEGSWPSGIRASVAVLIVACPCALGLAVPMAVMIGSSVGARRGILFKDPSALENAGTIDCCVLDKTGTITSGQMSVTDLRTSQWFEQSSALQHIHAVTKMSDHPVSRAITLRLRELNVRAREATGLHVLESGKGVFANVDSQEVYVGAPTPAILEAAGQQYKEMLAMGSGVAVATIGKRYAAIFALADRTKPHTRDAVKRLLGELKLRVIMLSGDHPSVAEAIALEAGIKDFRGGIQPEAKAAYIRALQAGEKGEKPLKVAMVGDGINDAPALATANVGIAISGTGGTGSDIAKQAGHIVLASGDVRLIPQAIVLSRAMIKHIQLGLMWAILYNAVLIPVAAMNMLSPMLAAGAMSLSSLCVIGNAMLLKRVRLD